MSDKGLALVTGGSGYIGSFCVMALLAEGWSVRTTVRNLKREPEVRRMLEAGGAQGLDRLSFAAAELMSDAGWADAAAGCSHVLHVASPIPAALPRNDDELVIPARDGTLRVLRAAKAAGVKRVVVTSSTAAICYGHGADRPAVFTEQHWTDPTHPDTSPYIRSKAIAERAAWDWLEREGAGLEMATVNPAAVLGRVLGTDFSASIEIVKKLMEGSLPGLPRFGFPLVDVRDIADLHVRAMTNPAAAGQRFIGGQGFYWMEDVAQMLRARLGEAARKVPSNRVPSWLVRILAQFDPVTRSVSFELDKERPVSSQKAQDLLGWRPRKPEDTVIETAESLMRVGMIKGLARAA